MFVVQDTNIIRIVQMSCRLDGSWILTLNLVKPKCLALTRMTWLEDNHLLFILMKIEQLNRILHFLSSFIMHKSFDLKDGVMAFLTRNFFTHITVLDYIKFQILRERVICSKFCQLVQSSHIPVVTVFLDVDNWIHTPTMFWFLVDQTILYSHENILDVSGWILV